MPIRWSAVRVSEAADMIEEFVNQAAEPLESAKIVAEQARRIANLPQYVDRDFASLISEIERAIGGGRWEQVGRLRSYVERIRKDIPDGAIKAECEAARHGRQQSLI